MQIPTHFRSSSPWIVWLTAAVLTLGLAACASDSETGSDNNLSEDFWPTEVMNGESGVAKEVLFDSFSGGFLEPEAAAPVLRDDFVGEDFAARQPATTRIGTGLQITTWSERAVDLSGDAFVERWNEYLAEFEEILETELHTWEVQLLPAADGTGIVTHEAVWILGRLADGRLREDRLFLILTLVKDSAGNWGLRRIASEEGRTVIGPGPYFRDVTAQVLPPGFDQTGAQIYTDGGPVLGDFDADGDIDLFLPRIHAPARLYANDGAGYFDDVTAEWGLEVNNLRLGSNSGLFLDVDDDGRIDLVVGMKREGMRVFRNEGRVFREVEGDEPAGGVGEWETMAAADYDGDGLIDIYRCNYNLIDADHQPESYVDSHDGLPNALLRNLGGGRFEEVSAAAGLGSAATRWTYAAAWADYDGDGHVDLYVANDYGPNNLFRNRGDGTFEDVTEAAGAADHGNGMGVSWADYDGDLNLDLYISNMQSFAGHRITLLEDFPGTAEQQRLYRRFAKGNTLLRNLGDGRFEDRTEAAGLSPAFWAWGNLPFDYDSDGDEDFFVSGGFYSGLSAKDT